MMTRVSRDASPIILCVVSLSLLVSGCGYRFAVEGMGPRIGGTSSEATGPLVRLIIREFRSRTLHSNLEFQYTNYMRRAFAASSGATVLDDAGQADFVMRGDIVSVTVPTLVFSTTEARENRVNVVVSVTVEDRKTGRIVWSDSATGTAEFFVNQSSDTETGQDQLQFNQVLQDRALEQAGQDVAERLAADFWNAREHGAFDLAEKRL